MKLPLLIRRYDWKLAYILAWGPYIAIYQITNRWSLFEPTVLPFSALDRAIPFLPELLPLYVSYIPFFYWTVVRSENDREANRIFYGTHLQLLLCVPFFIFFPVTMPRELYYGDQVYGWIDTFWRWFDSPNNCFPSLHVANCLLFIEFNWRRKLRILHTLTAVVIIGSTLAVKQHYAVDLLGGILVHLVSRSILARLEICGLNSRKKS